MKRYLAILIILVLGSGFGLAQGEKGRLFEKSENFGGFGGVSFNWSQQDPLLFHGEGAFRFSNYYVGGFGGGGDLNSMTSNVTNLEYDLTMGQGGFFIGAISQTSNGFALFADLKVGFGAVVARHQISEFVFEEHSGFITTVSPQIGVSFSYFSLVQAKLFVGYKVSNEVNLDNVLNYQANQPYVGVAVYLGSFY